MSAITAKASRKMKKYAVLTREPRCFLGSFDFSWEQRKLGELALFNPKDELPQTFEYVDLESVVGTEMLSHRTEVKSSAPSRAQRLAHTGDLFYQTVRPYQKNNYLFEKPDNNYVFSTGYAQMRPYVDGYFLLSLVQSERFVKVVLDNCTGTSYPAINANDLAEIEVAAPSDESEAQKIGTIFRSIDNLITLHQRKCVFLFGLFQASISMIFTASTFSWEQRKLTEFVEFFSGLTYTPNDVQENGTLVLRSSNVSNGEVVDADNIYVNPQVVNSENVKVGDIVVVVRNGSRSLIGKHAQIKAFMPNTVIGAFMTGIRSECPEFTNALLNTSRFEEEIAMNMGATINQITGYMFSKMEFKVPCLDEQKKIGEYFEKLDNLITLHQRKPFLMKWRTSDANRNQTNRLVL
jgi:type I restriction enzyme S subunit